MFQIQFQNLNMHFNIVGIQEYRFKGLHSRFSKFKIEVQLLYRKQQLRLTVTASSRGWAVVVVGTPATMRPLQIRQVRRVLDQVHVFHVFI